MTDGPQTEPLPARAGLSGGWLTALFVVVVALGVVIATMKGGTAAAEIGRPAPALAITLFDGQVFDLVEHVNAGRGPVLLNLWASWCAPCVREFPVLSAYALAHPEVTVVGVAVQDVEGDSRAFAERLGPAFLVGWDSDGSVREAYPSFGLPATFLISGDGTITDVILAELTAGRLAEIDLEGTS